MSIGDFSRVTHLSVKTLRHYHDVALLVPAEIDAATGYRYYSTEQVPAAQVVRRLRDLDMPIPEVREVMAAPEAGDRNKLIAAHLDRLEAALARTRRSVGELRDLLDRPAGPTPVEHRTVPPTPAIAVRGVVDRSDLLDWWQGALGELHATVRAQRLTATGPSGGLYASDIFQHDRGEATVFIPVDGAVRAVGRVESLVVPGAELAVLRHQGPLDDLDLAYGQLGSYATRHEISVAGPLRESYLRDAWTDDDPADWEIELGWPIFRAAR
jgi:DNA-binding transcriptional MerR regulator/effector-binding domain-containing protein